MSLWSFNELEFYENMEEINIPGDGNHIFRCYRDKDGTIVLRTIHRALLENHKCKRVTIPDCINKIGPAAFSCFYELEEIKLPESIEYIWDGAFNNCESLKELIIPSKVTEINDELCRNCYSLEKVTLPSGITQIGSDAFQCCKKLKEIKLSENIETIKSGCFCGTGIEKLVIPEHVIELENSAFAFCDCLKEIYIHKAVNTIDKFAFIGCPNIEKIEVEEGNENYYCPNDSNVIIDSNNILVLGCNNTIIPENVKVIGMSSFAYCSKIKKLSIPKNIEVIERYAFENCYNLKELYIPKELNVISSFAFSGCSRLSKIVVDKENPRYDSRDNCNGIIESNSNTLVLGCKNTEFVDSINRIGEGAFSSNQSIGEVEIPSNIKVIDSSAFSECMNLSNIIFSEGLTEIGENAFWKCVRLKHIKFPNTLKIIREDIFRECENLESIILPKNIEIFEFNSLSLDYIYTDEYKEHECFIYYYGDKSDYDAVSENLWNGRGCYYKDEWKFDQEGHPVPIIEK